MISAGEGWVSFTENHGRKAIFGCFKPAFMVDLQALFDVIRQTGQRKSLNFF